MRDPREHRRDVFTGANKHLQREAVSKYGRAIRTGALQRGPCEVCGNPKTHGHHEDYAAPLDIVWLCAFHHRARHAYGDTVEAMREGSQRWTPEVEAA